ncbi:MAG: hypothetical protein IKY85_00690 [Bacteroidaceae bacterium]|nr:hypothetical protein [Bacteroidaceae bacterium]
MENEKKAKPANSIATVSNNAVATASVEMVQFKTFKAKIKGEVQEIILARHKYSMDCLKASQMKQLEMIDKSKMLNVIYHVSTSEIFYSAEIALFDYEGNEIPTGTPNVYIPVETADTYYRFSIDEVLKTVEVHSFADVQEFAEVTGTTNLFSRGLTSKEKMGVAALATNDEVCNAIYDLAVETNMPASTAQLYLDVQVKGVTTSMMTTGYKPKDMCTLGRSYAEAKELHQKVCLTFGVNEAKKRYTIRALNYLQKAEGYTLVQLHKALDTIPANDVERTKLMRCGEKETCIVTVLISWIKELERNRQFAPAA